jgi:AraC-like DNA-binding protein
MKYPHRRKHLLAIHEGPIPSPVLRDSPASDGGKVIVTVLRSAIRQKIDAAVGDLHHFVHVETVGEALVHARQTPVAVLLLSPDALKSGESALRSMTRCTRTRGVVVLDEEPQDPELLLQLGGLGLSEAINLRNREGWSCLRQLLRDGTDPVFARVAAIVLQPLDDAAPGTRRFFAHLVRGAGCTKTVRALADRLGILPSTLMSRFQRARLPSPKTILAATRLLLAKALLENPRISVSLVTAQLGYSSTQAFGRHLRGMLGMPTSEFRRRVTFERVAHHYLDALIVRHLSTYRTFDPFPSYERPHPVEAEIPQRSPVCQ